MASDGVEVASTPEEPQSVSRPVSCGKEPVSEPRKKSPVARSAAGKKSRKRRLSPTPKPSKSKKEEVQTFQRSTRLHQARIPVKPRAPMMSVARLRQAASLSAKNLASPFRPMKMGSRSRPKC